MKDGEGRDINIVVGEFTGDAEKAFLLRDAEENAAIKDATISLYAGTVKKKI